MVTSSSGHVLSFWQPIASVLKNCALYSLSRATLFLSDPRSALYFSLFTIPAFLFLSKSRLSSLSLFSVFLLEHRLLFARPTLFLPCVALLRIGALSFRCLFLFLLLLLRFSCRCLRLRVRSAAVFDLLRAARQRKPLLRPVDLAAF